MEDPVASTKGVNTKEEEEEIDIAARIRDISDRMSLNRSSSSANKHRQVSSAIGSESPIGVLCELRESQERILSVMKDMVTMGEEREKREERRHKELCTLLLALNTRPSVETDANPSSYTAGHSFPSPGQKTEYFYGSVNLTSGTHVVSCVVMHLDSLLIQHPHFRKIQNTDKTFMDIKDWHNMCSNIINADKSSKAGLRIPKPNDNDFRSALSIMSSPVKGRRPASDVSHISALMSQSPELMNTVEWVRQAMLRCTGCLSPERHCRFRSIEHPFVNDSSELSVSVAGKLTMPTRAKHQNFLDMKSNDKKKYMNLILESSFTAEEAVQRVKGAA